MAAILEFRTSDPTDTISMLGGPIYLSAHSPVIAQQKGGGIYLDSPLSDGRTLVVKTRANAAERYDIKIVSDSHDHTALHTRNLFKLLAAASTYWTSRGRSGKLVYIVSKSTAASEKQYAIVMNASIPGLSNPFSSPFLQDRGRALENEVTLVVERSDWYDTPPGSSTALATADVTKSVNRINDPYFDSNWLTSFWSADATATVDFVVDDTPDTEGFSGRNVIDITMNSPGWSGATCDVYYLEAASYTITVRVRLKVGTARLVAYDAGTTNNPVTDEASTGDDWQTLSVTKVPTGPSNGITVGLECEGSGSSANFTNLFLGDAGVGQVNNVDTDYRVVNSYNNISGLTNILAYDATLTSYVDKYASQDLSYGLWQETSSPAVGDIIYFGSKLEQSTATVPNVGETVGGPFGGLVFNLQPGAAALSTEKITNTGFETDTTGWSVVEAVRSAGSAHGGSYKLAANADGGGATASGYSSVVGDSVNYSVWIRPKISTTDMDSYWLQWNHYIEFRIDWYDAVPTLLDSETLDIEQHDYWTGSDTSYRQFAILGSKPVGATQCKISVSLSHTTVPLGGGGPGASPQDFYVDDFSLKEPVATYDSVWEYFSGVVWTEITDIVDTTDELQNSGLGFVYWNQPLDESSLYMQPATINGILAYWVRLRLVTISGGALQNATADVFKPHIPTNSYIEINSSELGGELPVDLLLTIKDPTVAEGFVVLSSRALEDAYVDESASFSTTSTELYVGYSAGGLYYESGAIFDGVTIPTNATILSAHLFMTYGGWQGVTPKTFEIKYENSSNPAVWTDWTDFTGRSMSASKVDWLLDEVTWGAAGEGRFKSPDISSLITEIQAISGQDPGENMAFRIEPGTTGVNQWVTFQSTDHVDTAWGLEVTYMNNVGSKTSIISGMRRTSRGENFSPYLNLKRQGQPFVEVDAWFAPQWGRESQNLVAAYSSTPSGDFIDGMAKVATVTIHSPLSDEYSGSFKAYARAYNGNSANLWRLSYRAGINSPVAYNRPVFARTGFDLVNLGSVNIPVTEEYDRIEFTLWCDVNQVHARDLILMPSDEWFGEFGSGALTYGGGLAKGYELRVGDMSNPFKRPRAILFDEITSKRTGEFVSYASRPLAEPGETMRMWFLPTIDATLGITPEATLANRAVAGPQSTTVSLPEHLLMVKVAGKKRYSGKRGGG